MSVESKACDWFNKLEPPNQAIRCKTEFSSSSHCFIVFLSCMFRCLGPVLRLLLEKLLYTYFCLLQQTTKN